MTEFAVWAPGASRVRVRVAGEQDRALRRGRDGWWSVEVPNARTGSDYAFLLDDSGRPLPDPRSAWQPHGAHGPSRLYDHSAFVWSDGGWSGRQLPGSILYQLDVGTFTSAGTFDSALERLDHLVELGVDLVELLPVNTVDDVHDQGYHGAQWFAPHEAYGGPDALKRLVAACHARGLGVILDVVHSGPHGAVFAPYLRDSGTGGRRSTSIDGPHSDGVRRLMVDSVLMWLRDYHVDGLRLDAEQAPSGPWVSHLLDQLTSEVEALARHVGRPLWLIAGTDFDDPSLGTRRETGGPAPRWNDEACHGRHAVLAGGRQDHDPDVRPLQCLSGVLTDALLRSGRWRSFGGRGHGGDPGRVPGPRVAYPRQHGRSGAPPVDDRIPPGLTRGLLRVGATLLMTAPVTPMLLMGQEWAATAPKLVFTHEPEPGSTTVAAGGRRRGFAVSSRPEGKDADAAAPQAFGARRLDWTEVDQPGHREMLDFYRRLVALRRSRPDLSGPLDRADVCYGDQFVVVRRGRCVVAANLAAKAQRVTLPGVVRAVLLASGGGVTVMRDGVELPAESAVVVAA